MRQCLAHTSSNASQTFSRVIGLTNRPLTNEASLLDAEDTRWELHSGIDLEQGVPAVAEKLKTVKDIDQVSHVYFTCESGQQISLQRVKSSCCLVLDSVYLSR